jgi:hypothetical protein
MFLSQIIFAQETKNDLYKRMDIKLKGKLDSMNHKIYPKLSITISTGSNLIDEDLASIVEKPDYLSMDLRMSYQTIGRNIYDQLYRYPEWGIGYYAVKVYNDTVFGVPNAVFAYIDVPFGDKKPNNNWNFSYSIAGGMSYNFRPNNTQDNPWNTLIGSYNNVYIDLGLWANYRFRKSIDAKIGISFVHFSNGASTLPNKGMNLIGPKLILQHHMVQERPKVHVRDDIPEWKKRHGLTILQAVGTKQLEDQGRNYFNATTSLSYTYWMTYKSKLVVQLDGFFDSSNNSGEEGRELVPEVDRNNSANLWSIGAFGGYEAVYNRLSFITGWGYHVWRRYEYTSPHYQRFQV